MASESDQANCWAVLGLAGPSDVKAVKKAYARLLKINRPDQDAGAYQLLRRAYDEALRRATAMSALDDTKAAQRSLPRQPIATAEDPNEGERMGAATHPGVEPRTGLYSAPDVAQFDLNGLLERWKLALLNDRSTRKLTELSSFRRELDLIPIRSQPEASRAFADLVLANWHFPPVALSVLAERFDWTTDVRSDQALGSERAIALRTRLDLYHGGARPRALRPRAYYQEAMSLNGLLEEAGFARALGYSLLAHPNLTRQLFELNPLSAALLGMNPSTSESRRFLAQLAVVGRIAVVTALLFAVLGARPHATISPLTHVSWIFAALLGSLIVSGFIEGAHVCLRDGRGKLASTVAQLSAGFTHALSIAVLLLLGLLIAAANNGFWGSLKPSTFTLSLALFMLTLQIWPERRRWRFSLIPIWLGSFVMLSHWPGLTLPVNMAMIAAGLWVIGAHWAMISHHGRPCRHLQQPLTRYLRPDYLLAATVALPLSLLIGVYRYGIGHLLTVLALAWALSFAAGAGGNGLLMAGLAALLNVLLAMVHEGLASCAERLAQGTK